MNSEFGAIHTIMIKDEPWFMASEIAKILGYVNTSDIVRQFVRPKDRQTLKLPTLSTRYGNRICANPFRVFISERGLYSLVGHSHMPKAEEFMDWFYDEVLPSIRKYGMYLTPETAEKVIENPEIAKETAIQLQKAQERIQKLEPLAEYTQQVLQSPESVTITLIAKTVGWTAQALNQWLASHKVIHQRGRTWYPNKNYADKQWFTFNTAKYYDNNNHIHTSTNLHVTQLGRLALLKFLSDHDIPTPLDFGQNKSVVE